MVSTRNRRAAASAARAVDPSSPSPSSVPHRSNSSSGNGGEDLLEWRGIDGDDDVVMNNVQNDSGSGTTTSNEDLLDYDEDDILSGDTSIITSTTDSSVDIVNPVVTAVKNQPQSGGTTSRRVSPSKPSSVSAADIGQAVAAAIHSASPEKRRTRGLK
ncbi:hypothetical protein OIO90_006664, partial [Microbotryomycetes sp. JL221]